MRERFIMAAAVMMVAHPVTAYAQRVAALSLQIDHSAELPRNFTVPDTVNEVPAADLAFLGGLAGVVSWVPGAMLGAAAYEATHDNSHGDICGLVYIVWGGLIGATAGMAAGVHLANHRRGNLGADLLTAFGVGAAGLILAAAASKSDNGVPGIVWWAIPAAQVGFTVAVERWGERRKRRLLRQSLSERVEVGIARGRDGLGVAVSLAF